VVLSYLGDAATGRSDDVEATSHFDQSLALYRELDTDREHMARVLCRLGDLALKQGDSVLAGERYTASLQAAQMAGSPLRTAVALEVLARLAVLQGQPRRAVWLVAAAAALRERTGQVLSSAEHIALTHALAPAVDVLGAEQRAAAWAEGQALSREQAIAAALAVDPPR
jgi:hypothetical protein